MEQFNRPALCIFVRARCAVDNEDWEEFYIQAAKEVDGKRMPERVAAARAKVRPRLENLSQSTNHHEERQRLAKAIERLNALETDARKW